MSPGRLTVNQIHVKSRWIDGYFPGLLAGKVKPICRKNYGKYRRSAKSHRNVPLQVQRSAVIDKHRGSTIAEDLRHTVSKSETHENSSTVVIPGPVTR